MGVLNNRGCFPCAPTNEETLDAPPQGRPPTNADEDDNQERGTHADTREDGRCHREEEGGLGDDEACWGRRLREEEVQGHVLLLLPPQVRQHHARRVPSRLFPCVVDVSLRQSWEFRLYVSV